MIKQDYDMQDRPIVVDDCGLLVCVGDPFNGLWRLSLHTSMNPVDAACYAYWFAFMKPKGNQGIKEYINVVNAKRPTFKVEAHQ